MITKAKTWWTGRQQHKRDMKEWYEEQNVELRAIHQLETDCDFIDADTDRRDRLLIAQPPERLQPTAIGQLRQSFGVFVAVREPADVVDQQDVYAAESEPLQTLLMRAKDTVVRIIELGLERHW